MCKMLTPAGCPAESDTVDDERRILIIDGPEGALQQLAMDLLSHSHSVHYANDLAEAQLLAREEQGQIAIVLLSPSISLSDPAALAGRLAVSPLKLVPTGPRPDGKVLGRLYKSGMRWQLYDDPDFKSIRFVISTVLSEHDPTELRFYLRVPVEIDAVLRIGDGKGDVRINDVSLGGACILGDVVGAEGEAGQLDFELNDAPLSLPVRLAWSVDGPGDGVQVAGLAFTELLPETGDAIDDLVTSIVSPYRIGRRKPRPATETH